jgi:hypothetical protein
MPFSYRHHPHREGARVGLWSGIHSLTLVIRMPVRTHTTMTTPNGIATGTHGAFTDL